MKRYLNLFSALCLLVISTVQSKAQDIHFSQFYENAIMRNPALTGIFSGDYKAGVNYRTQWTNISVPFTTTLASAETRIAVNKEVGDYVSIGVSASYDHAGSIDFNSFQVYPAINYNKALEDKHFSYLSVGFAAGYIQRSVDASKMTFSSQYVNGNYSASNGSGETMTFNSIKHYDLSAGISLNSSIGENNNINYYIGAAAYHILKPKEVFNQNDAFIRLNTKWSGNFGLKYHIDNQYAVTFHLNYTNQAPYEEWIGGALGSWHAVDQAAYPFTFYLGAFYRLNDAIIPTVKMDYKSYSVTMSYDINNSSLRPASQGMGGFEISLYARGNYKKNKNGADITRCPRFEQDLDPTFQN